jgi:hypothetical protein
MPVGAPSLFVVGFGPFVGPDTGRPLTLARPYTMEVSGEGASWRWVDAEAGELNVKGWTNRPEIVTRGEPVTDPVGAAPHWFEVRPLVVFDRERVRAAGDAEAAKEMRAEAEGLRRSAAVEDARLVLPRALAEKFRLLPFRWK